MVGCFYVAHNTYSLKQKRRRKKRYLSHFAHITSKIIVLITFFRCFHYLFLVRCLVNIVHCLSSTKTEFLCTIAQLTSIQKTNWMGKTYNDHHQAPTNVIQKTEQRQESLLKLCFSQSIFIWTTRQQGKLYSLQLQLVVFLSVCVVLLFCCLLFAGAVSFHSISMFRQCYIVPNSSKITTTTKDEMQTVQRRCYICLCMCV